MAEVIPGGGSNVLTVNQIYATARAAGFPVYAATTATAIALAESKGDPNAIGDVSLEDAIYGPSVGLMQVRSVKADRGSGRSRDETRLRDPLFNMKAAYAVSAAGLNWTPWSTYTTTDPRHSYKQYMGVARGAQISTNVPNLKPTDSKGWTSWLKSIGVQVALGPFLGTAVGAAGLIPGVNDFAANPLAAAKSALELAGRAGAWMANSHNWARVALVVAGAAGVLIGLQMLAKAGAGPVSTVAAAPVKAAKAAASVVPAGRVAKVAAGAAKATKK